MFSKYFKARITGAQLTVRTKRGEDKIMLTLDMVYDFTTDLAACLGERAISVRAALEKDKDAGLYTSSSIIKLDTKTVGARFQHKGKKVHDIPQTAGLSARAATATKTSESPSLHVSLTMEMSSEHLDFAGEYINEGVQVRLDRQQLELPETEPGAEVVEEKEE